MFLCRVCKVELTDSNWDPSNRKMNSRICKECLSVRNKQYRQTHKKELKEYNKIYCKQYYIVNKKKINEQGKRYYQINKERLRKRNREYMKNNKEKMRAYTKKCSQKLKREVIQHYSPLMVCVRCGVSDIRVLTIDHIYGGGAQHRKEIPSGNIYTWLKHNNYPTDNYQVLCMNCNWLKREGGKNRYALDAIKHYSNNSMKCVRCDNDSIRELSVDHINGGGRKHAKEIGSNLARWLKNNNYPEGYQVLCMNCQFVKRVVEKEYSRLPSLDVKVLRDIDLTFIKKRLEELEEKIGK